MSVLDGFNIRIKQLEDDLARAFREIEALKHPSSKPAAEDAIVPVVVVQQPSAAQGKAAVQPAVPRDPNAPKE